jgi:hypothetical protein
MSQTEHDDAVGADPSPSRAEALGTGGAEPPPKQIRPMIGPTLIALPARRLAAVRPRSRLGAARLDDRSSLEPELPC